MDIQKTQQPDTAYHYPSGGGEVQIPNREQMRRMYKNRLNKKMSYQDFKQTLMEEIIKRRKRAL